MVEDTHANQTTAFRYDGALAQDIEARRQQGGKRRTCTTFPIPANQALTPTKKVLLPRHVPLPIRQGTPCRTPAGLHRHRHHLSIPANER